jgi:hypothetical protein
LNDKQSVEKYTKSLEKIENNIKMNTQKDEDHGQLTGQFRGAAHSICNLNYKNPRFIPVFFHSLSNYDAHLFIKQFGKDYSKIKLIPNTEKKYIMFSKVLRYDSNKQIELRFIDYLTIFQHHIFIFLVAIIYL